LDAAVNIVPFSWSAAGFSGCLLLNVHLHLLYTVFVFVTLSLNLCLQLCYEDLVSLCCIFVCILQQSDSRLVDPHGHVGPVLCLFLFFVCILLVNSAFKFTSNRTLFDFQCKCLVDSLGKLEFGLF